MSQRKTRTPSRAARPVPPAAEPRPVADATDTILGATGDVGERRGVSGWFVRRFAPDLGGYVLFPLFVLFMLNFVDEFDRVAFGILTPEIKDAFHLSNAEIGGVNAVQGVLVWVATPLVGFLADRWRRVTISAWGAVIWAVTAMASGVVPASMIWLFIVFRFGSGAAKTVNEPVHTTLLADYYPPARRGRVFSLHRSANAWGAIVAPGIAGLIGKLWGWRPAFLLMSVPTFVFAYLAFRLREPVRGGTEDAEAAVEAAKEPPVRFDRAVRWLYSVPTLKRIYIGAFFTGAGAAAFITYSNLFLRDEFGLGPFERGLLGVLGGVVALFGFWQGGTLTDRWQRTRTFREITLMFGGAIALIGVGLVFYSASRTLWMLLPFNFVVAYFNGMWLPPYLTIIGYVSPARIRSLGFSYAALFFALGAIGAPIAGAISDAHGENERWAMLFGSIVLAIGGAILASAARFVNKDVDRALKVLAMEATLRQERLSAGARSMLVVRELDVGYEGTQVLFGVNLEVTEGEIVALLGTNGAGKSTLLKAISGLVHPTSGAIFFDGKDVTHFEPEETAEVGIIQMPGGKSVFPTLTVKENLDMASWLYAKDRAYVEQSIRRVLEIFPVLRNRMEQQAGSMSGGEQQMLSLAQAFIARPRLLMIDELSLGLAPLVVQQLLGIVQEIHANGTTIILVEQSVNVALTVAQHAYFMEKGEIRFDGPTAELLQRADILRSVFLEGAQSLVGRNGARGDGHGAGNAARTRRRR